MKILISSDWHLDAVTAGVPRVAELEPYLDAIEEAIETQGIDAAILLGDFFDPGGMRAHELTTILIRAVYRLAGCVNDIVVVAGNHDVVETSEGWTTLSPLRAAVSAAGDLVADVWVAEQPGFQLCGYGSKKLFGVLALPYVARAAEKSGLVDEAILDAMRFDGPLIVAGHMTVPGAILGSESKELARGRDLDFPDISELKPVYAFNGHYHRAQVVDGPVPIVIPGSPWRVTFGEADDADKGFLVVEIPS